MLGSRTGPDEGAMIEFRRLQMQSRIAALMSAPVVAAGV
jgi:hypothetical protein